ncbi:maleylpyruvate isomerase [Rhizobium anhuiense]|uniref:maleylpyruvate isomerase N-terminal domain-containing protein n=1 Tax=Rhizobium anhuiense TaxID=1184720 RepID=UPI001440E7D0|nr:maleylpyruvate isomerase N-terminal domain-containing protein [Rhizobium anhuiense]NKM57736.1 maleylpyruvate isomerase [Rhizobium anhuiense]
MTGSTDARAELRERLGPGARYDDPKAPAQELRLARLGTAYFARKLNELSDRQLAAQTNEGLRFRRIVCDMAYRARSLAQIIEWVRNGVLTPGEDPFLAEADSVELGLTLPAAALRHLFKHSEVHLSVEWRDLRRDEWDAVLRLPSQKEVFVRDTAWQRARSIWLNAFDLGNGGSFADFPPDLVDALLAHGAQQWNHHEGFSLHASDRQMPVVFGRSTSDVIVRGKAADLARWVTGRGVHNVKATGPLPGIATNHSF